MARESFIVYKSFYGLIKLLKAPQKLAMYEAIFEFGFSGKLPQFSDEPSEAIWEAILPQLRANQKRYENGLKGGAPEGNSNAKKTTDGVIFETTETPTEKQPKGEEYKTTDGAEEKQPKNNQTTFYKTTEKQPNENVNVNVNENVNVVSKKESNLKKRENNTAPARESYDEILDGLCVNGAYREAIFRFIGHLKANHNVLMLNDRLEKLIIRLDMVYRTDIEKIREIDEAISKNYKRLECEVA